MNSGTIIRTVLRIAMSAYTAFMIWQATVASMGYKTLTIVWALLTIAFGWLVDFLTTYFNNDYTEAGAEGTGYTRQRKAEAKGEEIGVNVDGLDYLEDGDEDE